MVPLQDVSPSLEDRVRASTISGAITGATLGLVFRGPRNVIPGTIMFSLFGWGGQRAHNWLDQKHAAAIDKEKKMKEEGREEENVLQKFAKSKWSPMSELSDEEYERMVGEKILAVEVDIAMIDDKIKKLRKQQEEMALQQQKEKLQEKPQEKPS